jgi:hypothetical protein
MLLNTGPNITQSTHGLLTTLAFQLGAAAQVRGWRSCCSGAARSSGARRLGHRACSLPCCGGRGTQPPAAPTPPATHSTRPAPQQVQYALEGSVAVAGLGISWLRDNLGVISSPAESETLARCAGGQGARSSAHVPCTGTVGRACRRPRPREPVRLPGPQHYSSTAPPLRSAAALDRARPPPHPAPPLLPAGACPTPAASTLCLPSPACWRPTGRTARAAQSLASQVRGPPAASPARDSQPRSGESVRQPAS